VDSQGKTADAVKIVREDARKAVTADAPKVVVPAIAVAIVEAAAVALHVDVQRVSKNKCFRDRCPL